MDLDNIRVPSPSTKPCSENVLMLLVYKYEMDKKGKPDLASLLHIFIIPNKILS
jgi:hypothetical protein